MGIVQLLINGILLGSVYAMTGLGMSIVFGIVGLTNLAHGELIVLGAYASTLLAAVLGVDPILCLAITAPFMFLFGYGLQVLLVNRAMKRGGEPALLVTFALSIILQDGMLLLFSADARHAAADYSSMIIRLGELDISLLNLILFVISLSCVALLTFFLKKSYTGRAIRAVADDREAARLSGIKVGRVYAIAMGIATMTAAVAGTCVSLKWTFYPSSGGQYLLTAFLVVVIGGMDSIPGTLAAGLVFGMAQVIGGAKYGLLISYGVMLLALVLRSRKMEWQQDIAEQG